MSDAPSILSLRLSRAYGAPAEGVRTPQGVSGSTPVRELSRERPSASIRGLVAANVPGGIAFDDASGEPVQVRDAIPMYRRPADRNAAAVAIELGRAIDVRG